MKKIACLLTAIAILPTKSKAQDSLATRYGEAATITLRASVEEVFPLFTAYEEKKWAEGWDPLPIYPVTGVFEEGTLFRARGHGSSTPGELWIVSMYDTQRHIVQYTIPTQDRIMTIHITCKPGDSVNETRATISYSIIGLNKAGKAWAEHLIHRIFNKGLEDWSISINTYLENH